MQVDFKLTTWERITLDKEQHADLIQAIKDGEIITGSELIEQDNELQHKYLHGAEEYLSPDRNGGDPTIEIWEDDFETRYWANSSIPEFDKQIAKAKQLCEDGYNPEYLRGICELIAETYPLINTPIDVRVEQIESLIKSK